MQGNGLFGSLSIDVALLTKAQNAARSGQDVQDICSKWLFSILADLTRRNVHDSR